MKTGIEQRKQAVAALETFLRTISPCDSVSVYVWGVPHQYSFHVAEISFITGHSGASFMRTDSLYSKDGIGARLLLACEEWLAHQVYGEEFGPDEDIPDLETLIAKLLRETV